MAQAVHDVVFLPGLNTTAEVWAEVIEALPPSFAGHALDCPALTTVEAIATDLAARTPPRFHLVGFSFGGYVALAMLELFPERIASLVLVGSAATADNDAQRAYRKASLATVTAGEREASSEAGAALTMHDDTAADPAIMARYLGMMRAYGDKRYVAHMLACLARPDRTSILSGTATPVLVLSGEQDWVVSTNRQKAAAEAAHGEWIEIPGAGHQVPLEQPDILTDHLKAWLSQHG